MQIPITYAYSFFFRFFEENAVYTAPTTSMVDDKKPLPSQVVSWVSKPLNPTPNMQETNLPQARGPPPALPPKPKSRSTGMGFPSGKIAPTSSPPPTTLGATGKPVALLPPKTEQSLG